ncbi:MAG: VCBS repeat-containing protein [candidate division KSB1 bacterium]|nr:VCBS repeat-containing protein [candidate division KSB1 bacterium]
MLEFYTDDLCEGTIHYREAGSHDAWNTQKLTFRTVESRFHLTPDLIDQNIEFYVTSHNSSGLQTADDNDGAYYQVDLSQPPLPDMAFAPIGLDIEPGRILSEYSDYNSNGLPELIVSSQSDGGIGPLVLYELQNNAMIPVYTSEQRLIPRDLKDINGDGRPELLSGFGFNSYLYTSPSEGAFPSRLLKAWEGNGADQYWASRLADLDKDGKGQVIMRVVSSSDDQDMFKVFELQPDDTFESVADLPNPTPGENFYGVPHCEISDFDGDGYTDILFGDSDGDIYIYENKGDDQYQAVWQDSLPLIDSIDYIDHGDFDGDGVSEFIAGCHSQPNLNTEHYYDARHWLYRVYDRQGDNDYKVRAEWRFFGFESPSDFQSGVSAGDVDGDGDDEIYLSLFPDFYVIDHVDDHYKIIHYQMPAQTGSVLTGDLNVDGIPEYWMSDGNRIRAFALTSELTAPVPPVGLTAAPLDERTVSLNWRPVNGADSYTIFRGPKADTALGTCNAKTDHIH